MELPRALSETTSSRDGVLDVKPSASRRILKCVVLPSGGVTYVYKSSLLSRSAAMEVPRVLSESTSSRDSVLDVKLSAAIPRLICAVTPSGDYAYAFDDFTKCINAVDTRTGATW